MCYPIQHEYNPHVMSMMPTGETSVSLSQNYRLGRCSINRIIHDTCAAIVDILAKEFIRVSLLVNVIAPVATLL